MANSSPRPGLAWDLRGREPFRQETLPHPSINLVIEPDGAWIWGVPTKRDIRMLGGKGWAVGAKFRPGAFTTCTAIEAAQLTDDRVPVRASSFTSPIRLREQLRDASAANPEVVLAALDASLTRPHSPASPRARATLQSVFENLLDVRM